MIPRALIKLFILKSKGNVRKIVRSLKSPRRAICTIFGGGMMCLWLAQSVFFGVFSDAKLSIDSSRIITYSSLGVMLFSLIPLVKGTGARAGVMHFTLSEVDFLFPAPFTRKQVLAYKLLSMAPTLLFMTLLFSMFTLMLASSWWASFIAVSQALIFMILVPMILALIEVTVARHLYTRGRRIALVIIVCTVAAVIIEPVLNSDATSLSALREEVLNNPFVKVVLAPFSVFGRILVAEKTWPDMMIWAQVAIMMNFFLCVTLFTLDANYYEKAAEFSKKRHKMLTSFRQTGVLQVTDTKKAASRKVPMPPRMAGAGTMAWRQAMRLIRSSKRLYLVPAMILIGALLGGHFVSGNLTEDLAEVSGPGSMGIALYITFIIAKMVSFDFRGDLQHLEMFKTYPIKPSALVTGQIVVPVLLLTAFQMTIVGAGAILSGQVRWLMLTLVFAPLINALLMSTQNYFFLLMPERMHSQNIQAMGQNMISMMLTALSMFGAILVAAAIGAPAYFITDSYAVAGILAWLVLCVEVIAGISLVARAFDKFDPTKDIPA